MEYKIISFQSLLTNTKAIDKLVKAVNEAIASGWEPLGGVSISEHGFVAQAMVQKRR